MTIRARLRAAVMMRCEDVMGFLLVTMKARKSPEKPTVYRCASAQYEKMQINQQF
jgi:hypothetical protein